MLEVIHGLFDFIGDLLEAGPNQNSAHNMTTNNPSLTDTGNHPSW